MGQLGAMGRIVRFCALALGFCALTACSSSGPFGNTSRYGPKLVEDGDPVPKGGGSYKVGQTYRVRGRTYYPGEEPHYRAEGIASWYGPDFHGRATANGEIYDMHAISAAHPTLPMPSYVRVTNLDNGRSIMVRLNDRGPYASNRLIDLSVGAAKALDFYSRGLARVRVEYVGRAPMDGSDDQMLLATLRDGKPAQLPSTVMVASAKPFVPQLESPDPAGMPLPVERPYALGAPAAARAAALRSSEAAPKARSVVQVPNAGAAEQTGFAPSNQGLGLMSGRGLY
jgi:rare lipoprotein A